MSLVDELHEQPDAVARLLSAGRSAAHEVAAVLQRRDVTHAVVAARGTSDNAARFAQYAWGALAGTSVSLATPSLFGTYERPVRLDGAAVVVVSQSGQSPDLLAVARAAADQGRPLVAVTNDATSPLTEHATVVVDLHAGPEHAVAATKTFTTSLVAVAMVADALAGGTATGDLGRLPRLLDRALRGAGVEAAADVLATPDVAIVLGRGWHLASAHEWALKLQELSGLVAQPWSTADFEHGPVGAVGAHTPLLALSAASDPSHAHTGELLVRLARDRGAPVVLVGDAPVAGAGLHLPTPVAPATWLAPIVAAPAYQRVAIATALARDRDPDRPPGLQKVTRTR